MPPASSATGAITPAAGPRPFETIAAFLIRRRILISAVMFVLLISYSVAFGPKPHSLGNFRDPVTIAGVLLVVAGLAIRSWAAGILFKNAELTTVGPYRLIRNPLYAGSFLMIFGFCALVGYSIAFLVVLALLVAIYVVQVRQEEILLSSRFADAWQAYSRTTPRFIPRPRHVNLAADWRLSQWRKHREYQAIGASLLALAALQVWYLL
ncbi:MAG TPA: isoprenylcysteine carboxylmethyltransferase family protein [Pirellulales bacterium]|nr:isoprenylcysteine carboxylmethyltransferase family protein [Pirellulales bacterium]